MSLVVTTAPDSELLTVEEAKSHLRILTSDLDTEIAAKVRSARDDCERDTQRTFRTAVTRVMTLDAWWCSAKVMPWPPLLGITSIAYYDADNAAQTLSASNYHVELSTDGFGRVIWASNATLPSVYDRPDAITVTFTTGYASVSTLPPGMLEAMKIRLEELWGAETESRQKAAAQCSRSLLGKFDVTGYA